MCDAIVHHGLLSSRVTAQVGGSCPDQQQLRHALVSPEHHIALDEVRLDSQLVTRDGSPDSAAPLAMSNDPSGLPSLATAGLQRQLAKAATARRRARDALIPWNAGRTFAVSGQVGKPT
jgi:hypothetical protein